MSRTVIETEELERLRAAEQKLKKLQDRVAVVEKASRWLPWSHTYTWPVRSAISDAMDLVPISMIYR